MELNTDLAIQVDSLSVEYNVFIKKRKLRWGKMEPFSALEDISFSIPNGQSVALLGRNGSGKTTLLNTIAGQLRPIAGGVITVGKVYTLSGANPGLIPLLSGRENVKLLSEAYGIPPEEVEEFEKEVEEFCELGADYDKPYKTLSSGQAGRIGFGFTTTLSPDILLMDETLGVGDEEFRKKAEKKAEEFMKRGETIILSTHSLGLAKKMCSRGLVLEGGKLVFDGEIGESIKKYLELVNTE